jgi:SAM-dependent methyltransferase
MLKKLRETINREQFFPSGLGLLVNPFYFARKGLYTNIRELGKHVDGVTLDVGCGQKPYEKLFRSSRYVGLEIDNPENRMTKKADFFYDGTTFPFGDSSFDSVVTNEVLEHIFVPDVFLREIHRVLRPGGVLLMSVPFVWDEHEQPLDYARYSSFGLRSMLERNGFAIQEFRKSVNDIRVVFQLLNAYVYKKTMTKNKYLNLFMTLIFMAPVNVLGEIASKITPVNDDLYLDSIVLARKRDGETIRLPVGS